MALLEPGGGSDPADGGAAESAPVRLTLRQAQQFLDKCSDRTIKLLRAITAGDGSFLASDAASVMRCSFADLRTAWAGLTKRARTVTRNPAAELIIWTNAGQGDKRGTMDARTVQAFKEALQDVV